MDIMVLCAWCGRLKLTEDEWEPVQIYRQNSTHSLNSDLISHGICPDCVKRVKEDPDASAQESRADEGSERAAS